MEMELVKSPDEVRSDTPVDFTFEDRQRLVEIHAAITGLHKVVMDTLPALQSNPLVARMLGL